MTGFCICCLHCVCMCFHCTLFAFGVCATLVFCEMPAKLETTTQSKRRMQTQIPKYKELLKQSTIKHTKNTKNTKKKACNNNTQLLNKKHKHTHTQTVQTHEAKKAKCKTRNAKTDAIAKQGKQTTRNTTRKNNRQRNANSEHIKRCKSEQLPSRWP